MCTCITFINRDFYFGRNLDLEYSFGEQLVITPRRYPFFWSREGKTQEHYAMIGMGAAEPSYPLYAEAVNEKGLGMAGLNFPGNACYQPYRENMKNAASFELIPWILSRCATVREAEEQIRNLNVTDESFAEHMPPAPLHWMLADRERAIVLEAVKEGLKVYENPVGVLTNNPPFDFQLANLCNYMNLTARPPENRFAGELRLTSYGQGMGAIGLPGDASPASRFVRAAFMKENSVCGQEEADNVTQFFHILDQVSMIRGAVVTAEGKYDITAYSCCVNADRGIYYYKTYENSQIQAVDLRREDLNREDLIRYPLEREQKIRYIN